MTSTQSAKIMEVGDVRSGDVLMCFSKQDKSQVDGVAYSHVALALRDQRVLESSGSVGVRITSVENLLNEYDHIAVMRSSDFWDHAALQALEGFAGETSGKGFNRFGMLRFDERKKIHGETLMDQIESYFGGTLPPTQTIRDRYFCSELVTAAFIRVGIIDESAAPAFSPETMSPTDIAKDKAFGFFVGYLLSSPEYGLPDNDYFRIAI